MRHSTQRSTRQLMQDTPGTIGALRAVVGTLVAITLVAGSAVIAAAQIPTSATSSDNAALAALMDAVKTGRTAEVARMLAAGQPPSAAEPDGTTALHWAVHRDDIETTRALLEAGADVSATNRYGVAPMMVAATNGHDAILALLMESGADPNAATPEGETVLMTATRTGSVDAVERLLAAGADPNHAEKWHQQTALMWAAAQNQAAAAAALVRAGTHLDVRSQGGFTPLLFATREGHIEALQVLLDAGANPDDTLPNGMSALVLATYNAHYDLAVTLLEAGAKPDAAEQGWAALHQVVWTRRPNLGRNPPFPVPVGDRNGLDMARALLAHGANPNTRQTQEPRDGNRNLLKRLGATPFLLAAKAADAEMMQLLADHGADPGLTTDLGTTALMAAAGVGIWKIGENPGTNKEALEAATLAWALGNDINAADINGDTALHGAIHRGADGIVRFLADNGADLDATNGIGWTALSIAEGVFYPNTFNRHPDIVGLLEELGANPMVGRRRPEDLAPWERAAAVEPR